MTRKTKKTLIRAVAALLGFVLVVGAVSFIGKKTNGFADDITIDALTKRDLNPDNLYTADQLLFEANGKQKTGAGLTIAVNDDGSFVLDGKCSATETELIPFATVDLEEGTYTLTSGAATSKYGASLYLTPTTGATEDNTIPFDFGGVNGTVDTITAGKYYIMLSVAPETELDDVHFYPVIVKGDEAGEFYAD